MNRLKRLLQGAAAILIASLCFEANAGIYTGKIATIYIRQSDGIVYVVVQGTPTGKPACATNSNHYVMIKDENSAAGKRLLAALLTAHSVGRTVQILGANTCTRWVDGEDIDELYILSY